MCHDPENPGPGELDLLKNLCGRLNDHVVVLNYLGTQQPVEEAPGIEPEVSQPQPLFNLVKEQLDPQPEASTNEETGPEEHIEPENALEDETVEDEAQPKVLEGEAPVFEPLSEIEPEPEAEPEAVVQTEPEPLQELGLEPEQVVQSEPEPEPSPEPSAPGRVTAAVRQHHRSCSNSAQGSCRSLPSHFQVR